ncbi:MAG TPA: alpha/beta hydrolase [Chitinophaga sp.]|uniref:alpha/beta fold hydrolase n=1 Tax=Chitinophaga sp. TaxID=1869181 RepID=UPI002BDFAE27|nr:alpha/beta hydrolase [Chitinophaga sp.]HVI46211.1 alpha/beta hydrolase [Chitinophaga sp.]
MKHVSRFKLALFCIVAIGSIMACRKTNNHKKQTIVFVPGSFETGGAFSSVRDLLNQEGYDVITVTFPGRGDGSDPKTVTMEKYRDAVLAVIGSQRNIILVGHSLGGVPISLVAEKIPNQISKLVYQLAFLLKDGQNIFDFAGKDKETHLLPNLIYNAEHSAATVNPDSILSIFCEDCAASYKGKLLEANKPEPLRPLGDKISITDANYGKVPRYYIFTSKDKAVGPAIQKEMATASGVKMTYTLETSHSPHLSQPGQYVNIIKQIIAD